MHNNSNRHNRRSPVPVRSSTIQRMINDGATNGKFRLNIRASNTINSNGSSGIRIINSRYGHCSRRRRNNSIINSNSTNNTSNNDNNPNIRARSNNSNSENDRAN